MNCPSGDVTFLFTDIEGSTMLSQQFPDEMPSALEKHNSIVRDSVASQNGLVFKTIGDGFCSAFENAADAVYAAVEIQTRIRNETWNNAVIKIRIGINSGYAEWNGNDYMGYLTLAKTQRVMSASNGGQIVISVNSYKLLPENEINFGNKITFRDLGERKLKDLIAPIKLYQVNSEFLFSEFPPLNTLDTYPNNLPVQLTSFIGREEEINRLKKILRSSRIVTLLGPGGTGKTRLSLQVGADSIDDFSDGVFFVELASITDSFLIIENILNTIGVKVESGISHEETLNSYLINKNLLLILDNCEHLVHGCSVICQNLLTRCERLKILATSREILNCDGEIIYNVNPLPVPDSDIYNSPEELIKFSSVRLFTERALSVNHNFRLNEKNVKSLSGICQKLDGIPLAIELAAAKSKVLSLDKILEKLDDCFYILTGGKRNVLPRQQTLKALIDWSYDLLQESEKILWSRLCVFSGGWTLEAAEEICNDDKITKEEILDIINQLAEKSIIFFDQITGRYNILEVMKQYGYKKLIDNNESINLHKNHLEYYYMMLKTEDKTVTKNGDIFESIENDHRNLISAVEWSVKNDENEKGAAMTIELSNYWDMRGHYLSGISLMESILKDEKKLTKKTLAKIFMRCGILLRSIGEYEKAKSYFESALSLSKEMNDMLDVITCLQCIGIVEANLGNFKKAGIYFEESLALSRKKNYNSGIGFALNNLGNVYTLLGDLSKAEEYVEESLSLRRESGTLREIAYSLDSLGNINTEKKNFEQAKKYLEESLILNRNIGDKGGIAFSLNNLAGIEHQTGNIDKAKEYFDESLKLRIEMGDKTGIAYTTNNLGKIYLEEGNIQKAKQFLEESLKLRIEIGDKYGILHSIFSQIEVMESDGKFLVAAELLGAAEKMFEALGLNEQSNETGLIKKLNQSLREKITEENFLFHHEKGCGLSSEEILEIVLIENKMINRQS